MEGYRVKKVMIDGEVANLFDSDDESGLTQEEKEQRARFWGGKNRKYPSKKDTRLGRRQQKNSSSNNDCHVDDDDASGSQGSFAMVTTAGTFRASAISAMGMFSFSGNGKQTGEAAAAAAATPDHIMQDLSQSELEMDQMEADMLGHERNQKQHPKQTQKEQYQTKKQHCDNTAAITTFSEEEDDGTKNRGESVLPQLTKKKKKETALFCTIGIVLGLMMCALFAVGGFIMYRNKLQNGE